jgi:uncharacterized protein YndB with AHSA1/START domain
VNKNLIARVSMTTRAANSRVWNALVNPEAIREYMFGAVVTTNWKQGSTIVWKGVFKGTPYEDKGILLQVRPGQTMQYTHFSSLSGLPDEPENYHTVTIALSNQGKQTSVMLSQDKNPTESAREHAEKNWENMLAAMKTYLEKP